MGNPYRIAGPAIVSFSGGRTSAYMLRKILDAYDGELPADVHVAFENTGRERPETLRFVHECETRWNVKIHWLEWTPDGFEEVGFNSASRNGEPFAALIKKKKYTPNQQTRFCTMELKVRVMRDFTKSLGWDRFVSVVGLRYDEGHRVLKALERNDSNKEKFKAVMPLAKAKVTKRDVMAFWGEQEFDLGLRDYEGNCDLCFLKGRKQLEAIVRENPGVVDWWIKQEQSVGASFSKRFSYTELSTFVADQNHMFDVLDNSEYDVECGLLCEPDDEVS